MDSVLLAINNWLTSSTVVAFPGAFLWGMVSVLLSPCHMASIPLFIAYVAGQKRIPSPRQAARFALLFVAGLFLTIMGIGLICTAVGRMMGDVGPWWQGAVGVFLLWVAWTLLKPPKCSTTGNIMTRFQVQGASGALVLGLAYGMLSGACTFGFLAPILGMITMQDERMVGISMLILFGLGHCLPLALCGMFSAGTMELLHSRAGQQVVSVMRKIAAFMIAVIGVYFIVVATTS